MHHTNTYGIIYIWKFSASWTRRGDESSEAPQLKGARWFSYDELKRCTNNFSVSNVVGSGGYGKVIVGSMTNFYEQKLEMTFFYPTTPFRSIEECFQVDR